MRPLLDLFRSRNYRLFFAGQFVSQVGNWMTQTATLWLVYQLTSSVFLIGLVGFANQVPTLLLSPLAGVWIDRVDRVRLLTVTQLAAALHSSLLALLVLSGRADFTLLVLLASVHGTINAFDLPARQTLNSSLAEKREHLSSIISLNSSLVNLGRMAGPTFAGLVIAGWGAGFCFLIDTASYLVALALLLALRLERRSPRPRREGVRKELSEGVAIALRHPRIRLLLLVSAAVSVFFLSVFTLLPAYTKEVFGGSGRTLGLLMSSFSTGAAASGIFLAGRADPRDAGRVIHRGFLLAGAALLVFAWSTHVWLSVGCLVLMGVGSVMVVASSNTQVQHLVDDDKRGRIMSLYGVSFQGGMPLGALAAGFLAERIGLSWTSLVNGALSLGLAALLFPALIQLDQELLPALHPKPLEGLSP